jgi:hypothetical protein
VVPSSGRGELREKSMVAAAKLRNFRRRCIARVLHKPKDKKGAKAGYYYRKITKSI